MLSILLALQANAQSGDASYSIAANVDQAYLDHLEQLDILADRADAVAVDFTAEAAPADTSSDALPETVPPVSPAFAALVTLSAPACNASDSSRTELGVTTATSTTATSTRTTSRADRRSLAAVVPPLIQIDTGAVSVFAGTSQAGSPVGHVLATAPNPNTDARIETWFWSTASFDKLGGSFSLRMDNPEADADWMINHLNETDNNWEQKPYAPIPFDYITKPKKSDTDLAIYGGPKVNRYHFMLIQNNVTVGAMLRERHGWGGQAKFVVEHWLLFDGFKSLEKLGDRVYITKMNTAPPDAASFFASYESCTIKTYAQPIYHHGAMGGDFL